MPEAGPQFDPDEPGTLSPIGEPAMAMIPEGWFAMGCESGRDDEKPEHRVWIDRFELGIYQVTRAEYAQFLRETLQDAPPFWDDPNFQEPRQPVVGPSWFDAAGLLRLAERNLRPEISPALPKRNGSARRAEAWKGSLIAGEIRRPKNCPITRAAGRQARKSSDFTRPTRTGYSTWAITCTNGAPIGTTPITMSAVLSEIRKGRNKAAGALREAAPGVTTSRYPGARRGPASLLNSSTRTTVSAWRDLCEIDADERLVNSPPRWASLPGSPSAIFEVREERRADARIITP